MPFIGHGKVRAIAVDLYWIRGMSQHALPKHWTFREYPEGDPYEFDLTFAASYPIYGRIYLEEHTYTLCEMRYPAEQRTPVRIWYAPI